MNEQFIMFVGSIGIIQSLFLIAFILISQQKNIQNIILSLFLLVMSLWLLIAVVWMYSNFYYKVLMYSGHYIQIASGILLFLYIKYYKTDIKWQNNDVIHFILPGLLLTSFFVIEMPKKWGIYVYHFTMLHLLGYALAAGFLLWSRLNKKEELAVVEKPSKVWPVLLVTMLLIISGSYFLYKFFNFDRCFFGSGFYTLSIYGFNFFAFMHLKMFDSDAFLKQEKYKNINLSVKELQSYRDQIQNIMKTQQLYMDRSITLQKMSVLLGIPSYIVSHIINSEFAQNFSDFINVYRIEEAKKILSDSKKSHYKISTVSFECGFNSLSSFNTAFKKHTGLTPSKYKSAKRDGA